LEESDTVAALEFGLKMDTKFQKNYHCGFADGILASRRLTPSVTVSQHAPEMEKEQRNYL
jgi:LacI family transcriptional regulator